MLEVLSYCHGFDIMTEEATDSNIHPSKCPGYGALFQFVVGLSLAPVYVSTFVQCFVVGNIVVGCNGIWWQKYAFCETPRKHDWMLMIFGLTR